MWAMPPPCMSILSNVVGFVLAAMLLNVRGSDMYEEEDVEGEGEGGALGGIGRTDASSSAELRRDHRADLPSMNEWMEVSSPPIVGGEDMRRSLASPLPELSFRRCAFPSAPGSGDDTIRPLYVRGFVTATRLWGNGNG